MPPTADTGTATTASPRAWTVAHGLVRTRRASAPKPIEGYIWLWGAHGERYWVSFDGERVLRGRNLQTAEALQPGFIERMARAGAAAAATP
jgi:hypothetical protein